jgi:hypothetical protein
MAKPVSPNEVKLMLDLPKPLTVNRTDASAADVEQAENTPADETSLPEAGEPADDREESSAEQAIPIAAE